MFRVNDYRRKQLEPRTSQEILRSDHAANNALRALAQRDAMQDCAAWLASGNTVAVSTRNADRIRIRMIKRGLRGGNEPYSRLTSRYLANERKL